MEAQVFYVKQRMQAYFQRIAELSHVAEPPGKNAANGWFRDYMVQDGTIQLCGSSPTLPLAGDAQKLFQAYTNFYALLQNAFRANGNHSDTVFSTPQVAFDNLKKYVGDLVNIAGAIVDLFSGSQIDMGAALASLTKTIEKLATDVANSGTVWNGTHANGWISVYAVLAANSTTTQLLDPHFPPGTATDAGKIADILRAVCDHVGKLNTQGHNPWLLAEWQVDFEAIMRAAVVTLSSYGENTVILHRAKK